jgi:hypothetical protein
MWNELRINFDSSLTASIVIDSDTAKTYTKEFNSGGLTISYEVNSIPTSLPFTVVATDILDATSDGVGFVTLE